MIVITMLCLFCGVDSIMSFVCPTIRLLASGNLQQRPSWLLDQHSPISSLSTDPLANNISSWSVPINSSSRTDE